MRGPALGGAALFLALAVPAAARELTIDAAACAKTVRIHARDVPLQDIVSGLASAMGVQLVAKAQLPDPVSLDMSGAPEDVLKRLLRDKNLVVETRRKPECGAGEVLATIWLLPVGENAERAAAEPSKVRTPGSNRGGNRSMTDEERRQARRAWRDQQKQKKEEEEEEDSGR